jgi:thermostable 8-oxoguanine DNA glycosylase
MTVKMADGTMTELSQEEITRAVKALAYRKAYAKRPDVVAARRKYNQVRQVVVRLALQAWRRQQEGGAV